MMMVGRATHGMWTRGRWAWYNGEGGPGHTWVVGWRLLIFTESECHRYPGEEHGFACNGRNCEVTVLSR